MAQAGAVQPKPLMRGWLHAGAAVAAFVITSIYCWLSRNDVPKLLSLLIFGLSMIELYTVSALYHIGNWSPRVRGVLRSLDHANIFLLIAGTYTPLCFNVLAGWARVLLLGSIWLLAVLGLVLAIFTTRLPRWISPVLYVAMGWLAVLALPLFLARLPVVAILLLIGGGVLYTIGAIVYARRWPNPFPRVFGFHEVFHVFVIGGSAAFIIMIGSWVLPIMRM
ncbi:MAG: hemolysin III family protein [Ktedonobacterales bacterium]|nr:hemolysin III family protein [Ktedonobacterales bacterium]